ncbi:ABC transporter substrate-binding protein [Effusibacillus dendaii]|uniref:ABC transporter substrate-binding protein n=1 Tax=Effusibacillus dendaii TaxID=2743772 RepID=A0A7I8DAM9_9BACL|nr:ABC transporter substrate-binding protein [Effusibacillus dendaii]BCJ85580.1 ABC transporter substrate-binding protein [Effusibacillus dendaii]
MQIGALFPLSGAAALLGDESFRGVELAVKLRNKNGGVAGGKQVELVKTDAPDANAAQAEANRLITQKGLTLILGSYSSAISFAATEVTERNGVLFWEMGAISDPITERGYKYVFRTNPAASDFAKVQIQYIKEVVAPKLGKSPTDVRIGIVHEDSLYGTTVADFIRKMTNEEKMQLVTAQPYNMKSVDLSSVVLNVKQAKPDVLIAVSYLNDAILFWRQAKELGLDVPVFIGTGGGHTMSDLQKALGKDANGIIDVDFPQYEINKTYTPGLDQFVKLYKETYNEEPRSGHSLANFMGTNVLLDLIDKVGGIDPDKIKKVALDYKLEPGKSATGWGVDFDPVKGQNKLGKPYVHQWIDGKLVTVWPKGAAVQEAQLPMPKWSER